MVGSIFRYNAKTNSIGWKAAKKLSGYHGFQLHLMELRIVAAFT